ncbi:uncharacterized protein BO80DRAFT_53196 [Aspergillus ibericus CBS 121593]|uniref:Uncharacterized protein n=1 Tax=Aspergillus ibericus CBS 121593 TaxID=1448316 RepID=A0A395H203_9EURO|nr:hypothetical protein BO80DRAFT_53196 [Aspergillus ibericus CBS 121593]RAL01640.1 hypothetical protein BO80DRAFT_53196 [Aspergillus ibericus CBS 121593]
MMERMGEGVPSTRADGKGGREESWSASRRAGWMMQCATVRATIDKVGTAKELPHWPPVDSVLDSQARLEKLLGFSVLRWQELATKMRGKLGGPAAGGITLRSSGWITTSLLAMHRHHTGSIRSRVPSAGILRPLGLSDIFSQIAALSCLAMYSVEYRRDKIMASTVSCLVWCLQSRLS